MNPAEAEALAEVQRRRDHRAARAGTGWERLETFAERVSRDPPELPAELAVAAPGAGVALREDTATPSLPPGELERVAPEFRNRLLLVPRIL